MIQVSVQKEKDNYQSLTILGHAMYDDYGKDIVCSAVSSIVITSLNGILSLNDQALCYKQTKEGLLVFDIEADKTTQILIHNMVVLLQELAQNYPKNIQIK